MKSTLKLVVFISLLTLISSFAGIKAPEDESLLNPRYSITVYTKDGCYTGTCRIQDQSTLNVYTATSTGSYYYYGGSGLGPGTYTVVVCCDGMVGYGTVTLSGIVYAGVTTVEMHPGDCPDLGN